MSPPNGAKWSAIVVSGRLAISIRRTSRWRHPLERPCSPNQDCAACMTGYKLIHDVGSSLCQKFQLINFHGEFQRDYTGGCPLARHIVVRIMMLSFWLFEGPGLFKGSAGGFRMRLLTRIWRPLRLVTRAVIQFNCRVSSLPPSPFPLPMTSDSLASRLANSHLATHGRCICLHGQR
jgi:hypothetical protein